MTLSDVIASFDLHEILGGDFDTRRTKAYVTTNVVNGTLMDTSTGETRLGDQAVTIAADGTGTFTTWAPGADGNPISWQTSFVVDYPRAGHRDRTRRTFGPYTITGTSTTVTNKALTSNVATITTSTAHGLDAGNTVTIAGVDATFNGTFTLTAVTADTVSYAKTATDVTSVAATGTLTSPNIKLTSLEEEQAVPAEYLTTVTTLLDGYVTDAETAATAADASADAAAASAAAADAAILADLGTSDGQMTAIDGNALSAYRVQQDARHTATIATKVSTDTADSGSAIGAALDKRYKVQTMNLRDVVTPSGVNDTTAALAALAAFDAAGGGKLVIPRDDWIFTGSTGLALTGTSNPIHIEAEDGAVFDLTGSTATYGLRLGGSATATAAALGADVARGADAITCATVAAAVVAGDIVQIESTALFETTQSLVKGELAEVLSVSGSTITFKSGLFDSYTAATTTITKMQMPKVSVEGLTLLRNSNHIGLQISYARDVLLGGLYAEGARATLFGMERVFGGTVDNLKGRDFWYSGGTSCYGLQVNGQHIKEIGLDLRGGRHAISHGGTLPVRDIQTIGGTFDNYHPTALPCFDYHGNIEGASILGATILNGLGSGGSDLYVGGGSRIVGQNRQAVEINPSRSCNYVKIKNTDIETTAAWDAVTYTARNGSNATTLGLLEIDATIRSGATGVQIKPNSSSDTGATIDRLVVRGDVLAGGNSPAVAISKATAAYVGVNEAEFDGRFHAPGAASTMSLKGTSTGPAEFRGKFQTDGNGYRPIDITMFGDVDVRGATLKGTVTPFRSLFENVGGLYLNDVVIDGAFTAAFDADTNVTEVLQSNVRRINGAGAPLLPGRHFSTIDGGGKVDTQGTAAPTAGAWNVGDRCWNTAPAALGTPGWVCTTAGTPGTWKAMAVVSA